MRLPPPPPPHEKATVLMDEMDRAIVDVKSVLKRLAVKMGTTGDGKKPHA